MQKESINGKIKKKKRESDRVIKDREGQKQDLENNIQLLIKWGDDPLH